MTRLLALTNTVLGKPPAHQRWNRSKKIKDEDKQRPPDTTNYNISYRPKLLKLIQWDHDFNDYMPLILTKQYYSLT